MRAWRRRLTAWAGFALLALVVELAGRELTAVVDARLKVAPLATPSTPYYPFLLVGVKVLAAVALAVLAWRVVRALSSATSSRRLLAAVGRCALDVPRPRLSLSPRLWFASFAATSLWYLVQNDSGAVATGRWPLFAPWLHTYALPVFAVLSVAVALAWRAVRDWLADVEHYTEKTLAYACRLLRRSAPPVRPVRPLDDLGPRRLFGLSFESRPPPLAA
jgi:hypothetical protein